MATLHPSARRLITSTCTTLNHDAFAIKSCTTATRQSQRSPSEFTNEPFLFTDGSLYYNNLRSSVSTAYAPCHSSRGIRSPQPRSASLNTRCRLSRRDLHNYPTQPWKINNVEQTRNFHDYFVTHLPPTSMHPEARGRRHKLPRDHSTPHDHGDGKKQSRMPASVGSISREMLVVRIPLKSAKHHYGASSARGTRPYNEDQFQAGTIELPAFARRPPMSVMDNKKKKSNIDNREGISAEGASGDPQVFYFGVFDGHGGDKCSIFLKHKLHEYIERSAERFGMESSLPHNFPQAGRYPERDRDGEKDKGNSNSHHPDEPIPISETEQQQKNLVSTWKEIVGGYFRRFKPDYFTESAGGKGDALVASGIQKGRLECESEASTKTASPSSVESVLTYSFLRADLDFITADLPGAEAEVEAKEKSSLESTESASSTSDADFVDNSEELLLGRHSHHSNEKSPFLGGSTCSIALISTPAPTPFWHPSAHFSILTAHVGDTRIILCSTETGAPVPLTQTHHPSSPGEAARLRRYAGAFTTDSFGEERIAGFANTRSFGDRPSKRVGVSAEPEVRLLHARPAEFSFLVLCTDGVTASMKDQEIVDIVKEAQTPEIAARNVTNFATEMGASENERGDADNATCLVVRLGGWERRAEGGGGSIGTKEGREWRLNEAMSGGRKG